MSCLLSQVRICFSFYSFRSHYNVMLLYCVVSLCQNIRDLTPLTHDVISRQATINIGPSLFHILICWLYSVLNLCCVCAETDVRFEPNICPVNNQHIVHRHFISVYILRFVSYKMFIPSVVLLLILTEYYDAWPALRKNMHTYIQINYFRI